MTIESFIDQSIIAKMKQFNLAAQQIKDPQAGESKRYQTSLIKEALSTYGRANSVMVDISNAMNCDKKLVMDIAGIKKLPTRYAYGYEPIQGHCEEAETLGADVDKFEINFWRGDKQRLHATTLRLKAK